MKTLENIIEDIQNNANRAIEVAKSDYNVGMRDCKAGVYDKWYRYNHKDSGAAYDAGWMEQNQTTKNDIVKFIDAQ